MLHWLLSSGSHQIYCFIHLSLCFVFATIDNGDDGDGDSFGNEVKIFSWICRTKRIVFLLPLSLGIIIIKVVQS